MKVTLEYKKVIPLDSLTEYEVEVKLGDRLRDHQGKMLEVVGLVGVNELDLVVLADNQGNQETCTIENFVASLEDSTSLKWVTK